MKTYRLAMTALGLSTGDEFTSSDKGWKRFVEAGVLIEVRAKDRDEDAAVPEPEDPDGLQ